ncbi:MAG: hypothetical protein PT116_13925 [Aphanizomenon gracile PMC638.10]|nr:hypothetical protein [Aphanizomenon gracile PMC638.10]
MKLLIIDTETTDINDAKVCEIAATLYQVSDNVRETGAICSISTVLPVTENPAEFVNGISPELTLNAPGWIAQIFVETLNKMPNAADYAIAFNAEFDAPLVDNSRFAHFFWSSRNCQKNRKSRFRNGFSDFPKFSLNYPRC